MCEMLIVLPGKVADQIWIINHCVFFPFKRNCRYDGQIAVFGSKLQELLGRQRYFLVSGPVHSAVVLDLHFAVGLFCLFFSTIMITLY